MAKFMLLLGGVPTEKRDEAVNNHQEHMQRYLEWTSMLRAKGAMVASNKLFDLQGKRLTKKDGRVVDGPFVETKETIGGYFIIEAKDLNEAVELSRTCPTVLFQNGFVEVRPVEI